MCGPGHVPAGMCKARHETRGDGVSRRGKYDWYRRRSLFGGETTRRSKGNDDIDVEPNQLRE